jgi:hypothetical protein
VGKLAPLTRADILGPALYAPIRDDFRRKIIEMKRARRVGVGDKVTLTFENRDTLRFQVEEMLRTEGIASEVGIQAELDVYNTLMPTADSLSATLFLDPPRDEDPRVRLRRFIGLDEHVTLEVGAHALRAAFEPGRQDEDRISAVHYVRFPLPPAALAALRTPGTECALAIDHPSYTARTVLGEASRAALAADYD